MKNRPAEYGVWTDMRRRCLHRRSSKFSDYGGRGIKICKRWDSFDVFLNDMGPRPSKKHSLERLDNNGNYSPDNCVWSTAKVQANNRRSSRLLTYKGKTQTLSQWADELGVKYNTLKNRICNLNWPVDKALAKSVRFRKAA